MSKRNVSLLLSAFTVLMSSALSYARGPIPGITSENSFIIYYGDKYYTNPGAATGDLILNDGLIGDLSKYDVVVLQPNQSTFTPEVVQELKALNSDIIVLGYISIGEDFINDAIEDPLTGGSGMSVYNADSKSLEIDSSTDLQSFYIDVDTQNVSFNENGVVNKVETVARLQPDGKPDYNHNFFGYMVNPDNTWRWVIDNMRIDSNDVFGRRGKAGLKQLSGPRDPSDLRKRSGNFGFDGFFLDTIDTAGPYDDKGWYPWVIKEMTNTVKYISDTYPDKHVFANRGAFYFTAGLKSVVTEEYSIDYTIRPYVNAFLFESFRYDSNANTPGVTPFYDENRFNIAPKVFAEANRPDGFTVFGLEYKSGRANIENDAFNTSVNQFGFVSYLATNGDLNLVNNTFLDMLADAPADQEAPVWENTGYPINADGSNRVKVLPNSAGNGLVVQWDIAVDRSYPVSYDIVITDTNSGSTTTLQKVNFSTNDAWKYSPYDQPANQFTLENYDAAGSYLVQVQAVDAKGNRNASGEVVGYNTEASTSNPIASDYITFDGLLDEWSSLQSYPSDPNDVSGVDDNGYQANWRQIQVAHTSNDFYFAYTNETNIVVNYGFQLFIDSDNDSSTGFNQGVGGISQLPIGADYLIEGVTVYKHVGPGWEWEPAPAAEGFQVGRVWSGKTGEVQVPRHWIGSPQGAFRFVAFGNNDAFKAPNEFDWYPDGAVADGEFFEYIID